MLTWIQGKFARAIDWLTGTDYYANGGLPKAIKGAFNSAIGAWNRLSFTFPTWEFTVLTKKFTVGGWRVDTPNIPLLAAGGVTTAPTLAGIGERGSEAVLPMTDRRAMAMVASAIADAGGSGAPVVQVWIGDREITDIVRVEMRSAESARSSRIYAGRGM
jgi:hypothetical protein